MRSRKVVVQMICPACKKLLPNNPDAWFELDPVQVRNPLSRRDNATHICEACGMAEAIADYKKISDAKARAEMAGIALS